MDSSLLKRVIESFGRSTALHKDDVDQILAVSLGLDEADAQRQMLDVYRDYFQQPFLEATKRYYQAESDAFVANNSVSDYMKMAQDRLQEEANRVDYYLHDSTRKDVGYCHRVI